MLTARKRGVWLPVAVGLFVGLLASLAFGVESFDASCCVCDTSKAQVFFPYAVILNPRINGSLNDPSFAAAFLQWPAYGALLGLGWAKGGRRSRLFAACVALALTAGLSLAHYGASKVASEVVASLEYDPG
jgi:hypothetical protein